MSLSGEFKQKIKIELVKLLYNQVIFGLISEAICALGLVVGLWYGNYDHIELIIWFLFIILFSSVYRSCLFFYFKNKIQDTLKYEETNLWLVLFISGVIFSGLSWGYVGYAFVAHGIFLYQMLSILLLVGVVAGANPLYSSFKSIYAIFLTLSFLPFTILMLSQGNVLSIVGILGIVFIAFMLATSRYYSTMLNNTLALQFKNEMLVEQLEAHTSHLEKALALIRSTLESTTDGILVISADQKIETYNKKFISMWRIPLTIMQQGNGKIIFNAMASELQNPDLFNDLLSKLERKPEERIMGELKFLDNRVYEISSQPLYVGHQAVGQVFSYRDITARKMMEEKLFHQANFDVLTGLPNRALALDRMSQSMLLSKQSKLILAIFFLDLDRFKLINDTLGHVIGDNFLIEVAQRLKHCVKETDTVSREGGDEFLILLTRLENEKEAMEVADKILKEIVKPFYISGHKLNISISIGISFYPKDGTEPEILIKHADIAMYRAKEMGRNNYQCFTQEMNEKAITRLIMENHLREAIALNELNLVYQPIVSLKTGEIVSLEALLRWNHFKFGVLPISDVIALAEESGLIAPIGDWVLYTACMQIKKWEDMNIFGLQVAINISPQQFKQPNLLEKIRMIITETGVDPNMLSIEVTENVIMDNIEKAIETLKIMRQLGMNIVIDDFGTGYSSLSYLKQLPVDKVKIDQSFIKGIPYLEDDVAITATILALASNLKIKVIAEGVEKKEQMEFLLKRQCDEVQGGYFSKPVDVATCTMMLQKRKSLFSSNLSNKS